jgi:DNA uptake protein ComE-like DNA-binding protein
VNLISNIINLYVIDKGYQHIFVMRNKLFYWLKINLGFSNKESRGFLLLTPFLVVFAISPYLLKTIRNSGAQEFHQHYLATIDSLKKFEVEVKTSPNPIFNPADTAAKPSSISKTKNLNRIKFAEADSILLQIVPGIGPGLSGRIIKYRENLGGYYSKNQLNEIYGLKPETIEEIWTYFDFNPLISRKIPINSSDTNQLSAHPYISYGEAKVIIAYRNQHGQFNSVIDLKNIKIFKEEWISRIEPYLSFE